MLANLVDLTCLPIIVIENLNFLIKSLHIKTDLVSIWSHHLNQLDVRTWRRNFSNFCQKVKGMLHGERSVTTGENGAERRLWINGLRRRHQQPVDILQSGIGRKRQLGLVAGQV